MRRLLLLLPLCALILSPEGEKDTERPRTLDLKPFVDDGDPLPDAESMEKLLASKDPIAYVKVLENSLRRYQREVKGYTCTFQKQERLGKKLHPSETIAVTFRQDPFSVLFRWKEGARLADAALYVDGENKQKDADGNMKSFMVAHPAGIAGRLVKTVNRDPDPNNEDNKQSGRYTLPEFGIEKGTQNTLAAWKDAQNKGELHIEFLGETKLKEAGDRTCYKLRRTKYAKPEQDGITDLTIYIDKETWLQVGSVLKGENDVYIAQYYFRDIKLNPEFTEQTFKKEALTK
jgi:hypothetical protein